MWIVAQKKSQDHAAAINSDAGGILGVDKNVENGKWSVTITLCTDDLDACYILGDYGSEIEANAAFEEILSAIDYGCDIFRMPDEIMIEG